MGDLSNERVNERVFDRSNEGVTERMGDRSNERVNERTGDRSNERGNERMFDRSNERVNERRERDSGGEGGEGRREKHPGTTPGRGDWKEGRIERSATSSKRESRKRGGEYEEGIGDYMRYNDEESGLRSPGKGAGRRGERIRYSEVELKEATPEAFRGFIVKWNIF